MVAQVEDKQGTLPNDAREAIQPVISHLQEGLAAVAQELQDESLKVASGQLWTSDGCLPESYQPSRAVRMLGHWLQARVIQPVSEPQDPCKLDWTDIPWQSLSKQARLRVAFRLLDETHTGYVSVEAAQLFVASLGLISDAEAQEAMIAMEMNGALDMELSEFMEYATNALHSQDEDKQLSSLVPSTWAYHLSRKDVVDQLKMLFERVLVERSTPQVDSMPHATVESSVDGDGSGPHVKFEGDAADSDAQPQQQVVDWAVVMALARQHTGILDPSKLLQNIGNVTFSEKMPSTVDCEAFCEALQHVFAGVSQHALAKQLAPKLAGIEELSPVAHLHLAFQQHVRSQPLYAQAAWITPDEVLAMQQSESVSEVLGVDCRTEEECNVSTILEALLLEMLPNPTNALGTEPDPDALQDVSDAIQESVDAPTVGRPVVVTFCTDGSRSAMVALKLLEMFPSVKVHCLSGGLIGWFNAGHTLEDVDGMPCMALHPHTDELRSFMLQENEYDG